MNTITTMKGFLEDFTIKEAAEETLPADPGADVTDKAKVDKAEEAESAAKGKNGDKGTTMAKDVDEVAEAAKEDIADGYVADIQGEKVSTEKGWETFNRACASGVVVKDYGFNGDNAGSVIKSMQDNLVTKAGANQGPFASRPDPKTIGQTIKDTATGVKDTVVDTAKTAKDKTVGAGKAVRSWAARNPKTAIAAGVLGGAGLAGGVGYGAYKKAKKNQVPEETE